MDENSYRSTYSEINDLPCAFEKSILQQCCHCHKAKHFNLAERIGVACTNTDAQKQCRTFLSIMREKSVFALQLSKANNGKLPHAKEIKIQCGGINGLQELFKDSSDKDMDKDINQLLNHLIGEPSDLELLPYDRIIRSVVSFEGRKRRRKK